MGRQLEHYVAQTLARFAELPSSPSRMMGISSGRVSELIEPGTAKRSRPASRPASSVLMRTTVDLLTNEPVIATLAYLSARSKIHAVLTSKPGPDSGVEESELTKHSIMTSYTDPDYPEKGRSMHILYCTRFCGTGGTGGTARSQRRCRCYQRCDRVVPRVPPGTASGRELPSEYHLYRLYPLSITSVSQRQIISSRSDLYLNEITNTGLCLPRVKA